MTKTLKSILLALISICLLFALTGCGSNKLVATKSTEDSLFGKYEEKIEISFKDDKADKIVWTMEFENEDNAKSTYSMFESISGTDEFKGIEVKQDGKKITLNISSEAFSKLANLDDESMSKESIKKSLEDDEYTIK